MTKAKRKRGRPKKAAFDPAWDLLSLSADDITALLQNPADPGWVALAAENEADLEKLLFWDKSFVTHRQAGLNEWDAKRESKRDTAAKFEVVKRTLEKIREKTHKRMEQCRTVIYEKMVPKLGAYKSTYNTLKETLEIIDSQYGDVLSEPITIHHPHAAAFNHRFASAFLRAHKARRLAEQRAEALEEELKKLRTREAARKAEELSANRK